MPKNPLLINRLHNIIVQLAQTGLEFNADSIHDIFQQRYGMPIPNPRCVGAAITGVMDKIEFVRYEKSERRRGPISVYRHKPPEAS